jgi:dihydrofolate synthase / folylpolyglutamate synthase
MKVTPIRTPKIRANEQAMSQVLDAAIKELPESSVVAVSSKIVSLCEGNVVPIEGADKEELIKQESDYWLPATSNKYGFHFTITRNTLVAAAGIDESNADGNYVLWPVDPQKSANDIRAYLQKRFKLQKIGVIVTDSVTVPLRWGTMGTTIAFSGFNALTNYIGKPDIFGRNMVVSRAGIANGLGATAVLAMGEGAEQTPIVLFEDLPFVEFQDHDPTAEDLGTLNISLDEDLFGEILKNAPWQKGGRTS